MCVSACRPALYICNHIRLQRQGALPAWQLSSTLLYPVPRLPGSSSLPQASFAFFAEARYGGERDWTRSYWHPGVNERRLTATIG